MTGLFGTTGSEANTHSGLLANSTFLKAYRSFELVVEFPVRIPLTEGKKSIWRLRQYLLFGVGGITLATTMVSLLLLLVFRDVFTGFLILIPLLFPLFSLITSLVYPIMVYQRKRAKIDEELFLFITRVGVISIALVKRQTLFALMDEQAKDYGELAVEVGKIHSLITNWKLATPEACRIVARDSPSPLFADFLDRLAFAIETAENPRDFFRDEQEIVIKEYRTNYESAIGKLELWREMFIAVQIITAFLVTTFVIMALLSSVPIYLLMFSSVLGYAIFEVAITVLLYSIMPHDRIWHSHQVVTPQDRLLWTMFFVSLSVTLLLSLVVGGLIMAGIVDINPLFYLAAVSTPLIVPGVYAKYLEALIKRREATFAAFLRTLGHSAHTKGVEAVKALEKLRYHDFGALSPNINNLYARLVTRIDSEDSWNMFGAETQSDMISKFCKMYVEGARLGANTKDISTLISDNLTRILSAKKLRYLSSQIFNMMLGFLVFSLSFTYMLVFFIEGGIIESFSQLDVSNKSIQEFARYISVYHSFNPDILLWSMLSILFIHITISTIMSRIYSGGHRLIASYHVVLYLYLAVLGYILAKILMVIIL